MHTSSIEVLAPVESSPIKLENFMKKYKLYIPQKDSKQKESEQQNQRV